MKNFIIQSFQLGNVLHIEDVVRIIVGSQQFKDTGLQDVAHTNCIYLQVGVGCLELCDYRWYSSTPIGPSICKEHDLGPLVQEATVRGGKDMLPEALCHLSSVCGRSVVTGRPNAGCHFIDLSWIVIGPESGWAKLQFNVTAECEHSNCDITTEQFNDFCKNV